MSEPLFLSFEQIRRLHRLSIDRFGGADGIRDSALLESAALHPQQIYFYTEADLFDVAAAYAFHLAQAQACFDGNKRTAVAAALMFLEVNGISTDFDSLPLHAAMIAVAEKQMDKPELAALLRRLCQT